MSFVLLRIASRSFRRNRRRSLITASSVAFSVWLAVVFLGTRKSTYLRLLDAGTRAGYGHLTIANPAYFETQSGHSRIEVSSILAKISVIPGIRAILPRISSRAVIATANKSTGAALLGIDPTRESPDTNLMLASHVKGQILTADDTSGCYAGSALAEHLGVEIGGKIVYTTTATDGEMVSQVAYLRGTFRTGSGEIDNHTVLLPLKKLRETLAYGDDEVSFLAVYADQEADLPVIPRLDRAIVKSWFETLRDLANFMRIDDVVHRILLFFIGLIVASGILNTMMLSVLERRRELGVMLALGMTPLQLVAIVSLEAGFIAMLGLLMGAITSAPFYFYLNRYGLDLSGFIGQKVDAGGVSIDLVISCLLEWSDLRAIALVLLGLTLLAAALPAVRASTTDPIKTIREP